jgi:hypothetical protein
MRRIQGKMYVERLHRIQGKIYVGKAAPSPRKDVC